MPLGFPFGGQLWYRTCRKARFEVVVGHIRLASGGIYSTDESVSTYVGKVAFVFEPRAGGRDGVGCALAFDFIEHSEGMKITRGGGSKRFQNGKTRGCRGDENWL